MKDQDGIRNSSAISFLLRKIMAGSGLVDTISQIFVDVASAETLPLWGLWSSYVINFFAPSGGGHWVVQGPFMVEAAKQMGASLSQISMSVMLGNAWNDLIKPFWILPVLAISGLKLKDVMGYLVIMMIG
jgi:short-chain fatty acids transporter